MCGAVDLIYLRIGAAAGAVLTGDFIVRHAAEFYR